jgi:hypothetical protein
MHIHVSTRINLSTGNTHTAAVSEIKETGKFSTEVGTAFVNDKPCFSFRLLTMDYSTEMTQYTETYQRLHQTDKRNRMSVADGSEQIMIQDT